MDRGRARVAGICLVLLAVACVAARIRWVNTNLPSIPVEYYQMGEWVELDGCFQDGGDREQTRGYSLMVESVDIVTCDEYLERHGAVPSGAYGDAQCVADVALRIKNDGSEQGGINIFQMVLTPARGDEYLICDIMSDDALWLKTEPNADSSVSIRPGTEYVTHIPYVFNGGDETYARDIVDRDFTLLCSRMPVRKMICATVQ